MRLFIAINFDDKTIAALVRQQRRVQAIAQKGNYSRRDNLHLTLAFLGETPIEDVGLLQTIVDTTNVQAFPITLDTLGYFARNNSDIWWVGIAKNPPLERLQHTLVQHLRIHGFSIDKRPFTPHITIGREIRIPNADQRAQIARPITPIRCIAQRISLMQSVRIDGVLVYRELMGKNLINQERGTHTETDSPKQ